MVVWQHFREESPAEWSKVKNGFLELDKRGRRFSPQPERVSSALLCSRATRKRRAELYQRIGENGDEKVGEPIRAIDCGAIGLIRPRLAWRTTLLC